MVIVELEKPLAFEEVTVRVELDVPGFGENDAVTFAGSPLTLKVTWPENPLVGVIVTV